MLNYSCCKDIKKKKNIQFYFRYFPYKSPKVTVLQSAQNKNASFIVKMNVRHVLTNPKIQRFATLSASDSLYFFETYGEDICRFLRDAETVIRTLSYDPYYTPLRITQHKLSVLLYQRQLKISKEVADKLRPSHSERYKTVAPFCRSDGKWEHNLVCVQRNAILGTRQYEVFVKMSA